MKEAKSTRPLDPDPLGMKKPSRPGHVAKYLFLEGSAGLRYGEESQARFFRARLGDGKIKLDSDQRFRATTSRNAH